MTALTNILTHLLMLLMILIMACTEETAEVNNLMRQEQYVTVRMQVPGMTTAATRADDGVIGTITALSFDANNELLAIKTAIDLTENGFKIVVPNDAKNIHFLANLPNGVTLPAEMGGKEVDVMTDLVTTNNTDLCYWGMATYDDSNSTLSTTLYRNMAKISIKPSITDIEFNQFTEDKLRITALYNANQSGTLVPYKETFNFSMNNGYYTLPNEVSMGNVVYNEPYSAWAYAFEHANTSATPLCVICEIGDNSFYKVALVDDNGSPRPIIRNHEYIIYVSDVDDYKTDDYRANSPKDALNKKPINLEVQEEVNTIVQLAIKADATQLQYSTTATEEVTISVTVPAGVQTLSVDADGFTVTSGDNKIEAQDGGYRLKNDTSSEQVVRFKLRLNNDAMTTHTITVNGTGVNNHTIVNSASITLTTSAYEAAQNEQLLWIGAVELVGGEGGDDETKIPIPYSLFFDHGSNVSKIPVGSEIRIYYSDIGDGEHWMQANDPNTWGQIATDGEGNGEGNFTYSDNQAILTLSQTVLDAIHNSGADDDRYITWNSVDAAFIVQGLNRLLTKITLILGENEGSINANATTSTTLYYDSNEEQTVTVQVTVPAGVETLNISAADFVKVTQNGTELANNEGSFTYTVGEQKTIDFVFTLKSGIQNAGTSTIRFTAQNVTQKDVQITLEQCPRVTFINTGTQTIQMGGNPLTVTMDMPDDGKTLSNFSITVSPTNGLDVAQNGNSLTLTEGIYTTTNISSDQTFTFTPTNTGIYTITFNGEGIDVNMPAENSRTINLRVNAAEVTGMSATAVNGDSTIDLDSGDTNVTFTLTKPASVQGVSINIADIYVTDFFTIAVSGNNTQYQNGNTVYDFGNNETIGITLTVKNNTIPSGSYNVTFTGNYNGQDITATAMIEVVNTPKLQYSYGGTTLYMKDSNGEANPTSLDVKVTVPDGSTLSELIISAPGFTIKQGETVLSENGSHTYTGGVSTTFTFTPTSAGTKTISFSGTNENLIVNKEIPVTVVDGNAPKEIVIWGEDIVVSWTAFELKDERLINASEITFDVEVSDAEERQIQLNMPGYLYISKESLPKNEKVTLTVSTTQSSMAPDGTLKIVGQNVTITKIYIIPAPTTE